MRPNTFDDIFHFTAPPHADQIALEMKPVVFQVPERADQASRMIYVAVEGRLSFNRQAIGQDEYLATSFATHVGYFRYKNRSLTHCYGAHYDLDASKPGHPVVHQQFQTMEHLGAVVEERFSLVVEERVDLVKPLFRQVRVPTAHIDGFSILVQICADHLLHKGSSAADVGSFKKVLQSCNVYKGVGHQIAYLNSGNAPICYRSLHWYPQIA